MNSRRPYHESAEPSNLRQQPIEEEKKEQAPNAQEIEIRVDDQEEEEKKEPLSDGSHGELETADIDEL